MKRSPSKLLLTVVQSAVIFVSHATLFIVLYPLQARTPK